MKYPKVGKSTEIFEIAIINYDYFCEGIGYYAYGHWDLQSFAIVTNQRYHLAKDENPVRLSDVKRGYIKTVDINSADELMPSDFPQAGYEAATYSDT
jgi:hypothetical protein